KQRQSVPGHRLRELKNAPMQAYELDLQSEHVHLESKDIKNDQGDDTEVELRSIIINNQQINLPANFIKLLGE
ncbi:GTP pyrophosphokinase, partial [Paenibacillus jilunlii]